MARRLTFTTERPSAFLGSLQEAIEDNAMLNLHAAIDAHRYWKNFEQTCAENGSKVDCSILLSSLRSFHGEIDGVVGTLRSTGIALVDNYWPAEKCAAARGELDRIIAQYPDAVNIFSGGADRRMFGVEEVSPLLCEFHHDPFLRGVGELVGGLALYNFATLGARIDATEANNGSGDGWHRDGHGYQFKSILYLSDVTDDNGPFEFLPGSHKRWRAAFDIALGGLPPPPSTRYEPVVVDRMVNQFGLKRQHYPAKAGTLLLVNTSGIHRGRPLQSGSRYALTNYYYHPFQISESRIEQFAPMMPGTAERIRSDLSLASA
jgi:Phytanoyl-CoA dioxygenase (PhyH)